MNASNSVNCGSINSPMSLGERVWALSQQDPERLIQSPSRGTVYPMDKSGICQANTSPWLGSVPSWVSQQKVGSSISSI